MRQSKCATEQKPHQLTIPYPRKKRSTCVQERQAEKYGYNDPLAGSAHFPTDRFTDGFDPLRVDFNTMISTLRTPWETVDASAAQITQAIVK